MIGSAVMAAASAPFFAALMEVKPSRRHLMPEERAGLAIFLLSGLAGLAALWPPAALTAGFAGALAAAPLGAGAGACAGLAAAGALMLAGCDPGRALALGACGMWPRWRTRAGGGRRRWRWPLRARFRRWRWARQPPKPCARRSPRSQCWPCRSGIWRARGGGWWGKRAARAIPIGLPRGCARSPGESCAP